MKLPVPFIQLPLRFDVDRLVEEISVIDEADWRPHPQGFAGNSMLPLVAVDGDPDNEAFAGAMAPTPALARCGYMQEVLASFGATVGRSRLMRLSGQSEVKRHVDQGYYWIERVRVHVPILTQPTVRFECGDQAINMAAGECWIFDTWRPHRVINDAERERIHLVVDTVGGAAFWDLVADGRAAGDTAAWQARHIAPGSVPVTFGCERVNVPRVMSPWEMSTHFSMLFGDAVPHPALPRLQAIVARLLRAWQGLWFRHGPEIPDRAPFQRLLDQFVADARPVAENVMLANGIRWMSGAMTIVVQFAAGGHERVAARPYA